MAFAFDNDTTITRVDEAIWTTHLDPKWSINVVPNGGYSTTGMVRAMLDATGREHPLSVTTHFYKTCDHDSDATITVTKHRSGNTFANAGAVLTQGERERSRCVAVLGSLPRPDVADTETPPPPSLAPPEQCLLRESGEHSAQGFPIPLADMVEMRIDRELGTGGPAQFGGWLRFVDGRPPDALALGLFADALPPAQLVVNPSIGWVPTLELTVHVRREPVDGWIRAAVLAADVQGKLLIEDVRLWDDSGALVAQARQLAMLLT